MIKKYFFFCILLTFTWACKDDIENPSLTITPTDYLQLADTGEVVHFTVKASAYKNHTLQKLKISYYTESETTQIILDSTQNTDNAYYEFDFKVPAYTDTTKVTFVFYVVDDAGNSLKLQRTLWIQTYSANSELLSEISGNTLYSDPNYHNTAFNLLTCELLNCNYSDSSKLHIESCFDSTHPDSLVTKWVSPAGLKFVKFNDFDYANASQLSTKSAYEAGAKSDFISSMNNNDIYLTKISSGSTERYVAIRIMNIYDNTGSKNDMFIFNVKK